MHATVKDSRHGLIRLDQEPLDVVLGKDGEWSGKGAGALNALRGRGETFRLRLPWPRRLQKLQLTDCTLAIDTAACKRLDLDDDAAEIAIRSLGEGTLEPVVAARLDAIPGARIRGLYLHEIE